MFSLLKPTFSLPRCPHPLTLMLLSNVERSPTDYINPTASANYLAPFIFGAGALDQ